MITSGQLVIGVLSGCVLILFGLVPGLVNALIDGIRNFRDSLGSSSFTPHWHEPVRQPAWLAIVGAALIAFTIVAYTLP